MIFGKQYYCNSHIVSRTRWQWNEWGKKQLLITLFFYHIYESFMQGLILVSVLKRIIYFGSTKKNPSHRIQGQQQQASREPFSLQDSWAASTRTNEMSPSEEDRGISVGQIYLIIYIRYKLRIPCVTSKC